MDTRFGITTTNNPTGEPVAWVGKTPLRPLARPQDRSGSPTKGAPTPTNQPRSASPVLGGKPSRSTRFTNNPTGEPVAWVGKTPLRPLARPQDRSGSPTKGAKLAGGNLPDCRLRAPSPTTNN
ncbi:MAG: hypothetical protein ACHBN1_29025 [Heteroscytonema crispum UTEX LB 1556]